MNEEEAAWHGHQHDPYKEEIRWQEDYAYEPELDGFDYLPGLLPIYGAVGRRSATARHWQWTDWTGPGPATNLVYTSRRPYAVPAAPTNIPDFMFPFIPISATAIPITVLVTLGHIAVDDFAFFAIGSSQLQSPTVSAGPGGTALTWTQIGTTRTDASWATSMALYYARVTSTLTGNETVTVSWTPSTPSRSYVFVRVGYVRGADWSVSPPVLNVQETTSTIEIAIPHDVTFPFNTFARETNIGVVLGIRPPMAYVTLPSGWTRMGGSFSHQAFDADARGSGQPTFTAQDPPEQTGGVTIWPVTGFELSSAG